MYISFKNCFFLFLLCHGTSPLHYYRHTILLFWWSLLFEKNYIDAVKEFLLFLKATLGWQSSKFKRSVTKPKPFLYTVRVMHTSFHNAEEFLFWSTEINALAYCFSQERGIDRNKKLNSILRRHSSFIITGLGDKN